MRTYRDLVKVATYLKAKPGRSRSEIAAQPVVDFPLESEEKKLRSTELAGRL